jgi:ATP-binding cassette subfamily B protein
VTHRLATASEADLIFVLDRGRLVERGSHSELMAENGLYRRLYEEQASGGESASQQALQIAYLRSVPLFSQLDDEALTRIAGLLHAEQAGTGREVVHIGDPADRFYLIVSGELEVVVPDVAGGEQRLATLSAGDYFGEMGLLRDVPRNATVRATTGAHLLSLSRDSLGGLVAAMPLLRTNLEAAMDARDAATLAAR